MAAARAGEGADAQDDGELEGDIDADQYQEDLSNLEDPHLRG